MFCGRFQHSIDSKGRTSLPARFRETLYGHLSAAENGSPGSEAANDATAASRKASPKPRQQTPPEASTPSHSAPPDAPSIVITTALDPCLVAYPVEEWRRFEARLAALPHLDPDVRLLQRCIVSGALEFAPDRHGRLVLPATMRAHAGIEGEVLFAGMGRFIELWSPERFSALTQAVIDEPERKARLLARLAELGV